MRFRILIAMALLSTVPTIAQECTTGCEKVLENAPFDTKDVVSGSSYQSYFHSLLCSANWENYSEAQSAGISTIIPVYGMKLPLNLNWDNNKKKEWKSENCSEEERSLDYRTALTVAVKTVHPEVVPAWLECVRIKCSKPKSEISCSVKETADNVIFHASWDGGSFASLSKPPKVISADVFASDCKNVPRQGDSVDAAGLTVSCSPKSSEEPLFVLQTKRGACSVSLSDAQGDASLTGTVSLSDSRYIKAAHVTLDSTTFVTNGHNLTIESETLELRGAPKIISFDTEARAETSGQAAGFVKIIARRIIGTGLEIRNFGQNGGPGNSGANGANGGPGVGGSVRDCLGCGGGSNGSPGGAGGNGAAGHPGAPGGAGGTVSLVFPEDVPTDKIVVFQDRIDPDTNTKQDCGGTCGGNGGKGGAGGSGGAGGPGGGGAGSNCTCGGTSAGSPGANGAAGAAGARGTNGSPGVVLHASILKRVPPPARPRSRQWIWWLGLGLLGIVASLIWFLWKKRK